MEAIAKDLESFDVVAFQEVWMESVCLIEVDFNALG